MSNTPTKLKVSAIQVPQKDLDNHTDILRQLKESAEVSQRLRGDPLDSFVRVSEMVALGLARLVTGTLQPPATGGVKVAQLPSPVSVGAGTRSFVLDATNNTFGAAVVAGGTNKVPVYSDGVAWKVG